MAAPTAKYDRGGFVDSPAEQEANLLVESVDFESTREKKFWKSIETDADVWRRDSNPKCKWSIKGWVSAVSGFVTQHVGTTVATLANFASTFAGFDPAVGLLTFNDAKHSFAIGDQRKMDFVVEHDPFVLAA
jgi:hypothetical protein